MQQYSVVPRFPAQTADPALTFGPQLNQPHQASDTRQELDYSLVHTELLYMNHKHVQTGKLRSPDSRTLRSHFFVTVIYTYSFCIFLS